MKLKSGIGRVLAVSCVVSATTFATPSHASVVFSYSGVIGQNNVPSWPFEPTSLFSPYFDSETNLFTFGLRLPDPQYTLPLVLSSFPTSVPLPPNQKYRLELNLPSAPVAADKYIGTDVWADSYYLQPDGSYHYGPGGYDTLGVFFPSYQPASTQGRSVILNIDDMFGFGPVGCGIPGITCIYSQFTWTDPVAVEAQLLPSDAGRPFSIVLTAVPEPPTWLTMIFGFGTLGGVLRRRRRLKVALD